MHDNVIVKNGGNSSMTSDGILKATALLYFKEALLKEEYEGCAELIGIAKKLGVQQSEINKVIAEYIRGFKAGGPHEANQKKKGRLRF